MEPKGLSEEEKTMWQKFLQYSGKSTNPEKIQYLKDHIPDLEVAVAVLIPKIEAVTTLEELSALTGDINQAFSFALHRQAAEK